MGVRVKLTAASATTALFMFLAVSSASASHLSISHGSLWRAVFNPITLSGFGVAQDRCRLTLEGSFHSATIAKVSEALIGHISRASIARPCELGEATVLQETLPWHLRYASFTGTLPRIEGVKLRLVGLAFNLSTSFGVCLERSEAARPWVFNVNIRKEAYEANGNAIISNLEAEPNATIRCGSLFEGSLSGTAAVTELPGGSANLLIRLI